MRHPIGLIARIVLVCSPCTALAGTIDLTHATIVIRDGDLPAAEKIAPVILVEEMAKRTGIQWQVARQWPSNASAVIALVNRSAPPKWSAQLPTADSRTAGKAEGFSIRALSPQVGRPAAVLIGGNDPRGVMFGVGKLLQSLGWGRGTITLPADFACDLSPDRSLRGHQVGYRATANSWDAWTVEQFDQYFRDLAVFGANAVENIPFQDEKPAPLMKYPRKVMNRKFAELCAKYDLDHWVWVPVSFLLPNAEREAKFLIEQEAFYKECRRLDAVFVPGGDPGDNLVKNLVPFVEKMAAVLRKHHPKATIWISMQRPHPGDVDAFFAYLETNRPAWFGGAVMGPSGPSMEITRRRLPKEYKLRWYPDVTHVVRCQYPVPWLDPAWGMTLGREPVNPRPVGYASIYHNDYRYTDGFISYSDGIHDDFNKNLWTQLGWAPDRPVREIAADYARYYFRGDLAETGADAILALEADWNGSIAENGSVEGTLRQWQQLEKKLGGHPTNWRFDLHLFRAYYDGYTRSRQLYETQLEQQALETLRRVDAIGLEPALKTAREILARATTQRAHKDWLNRVEALADHLFQVIGYQTSVPKYGGSGSERGCVMDFVNYPLNNRWWLEDQFDAIAAMSSRSASLKRIDEIVNWENAGEGGFYDVIGDVGRSPHILKLFDSGDAMRAYYELPMPTHRSLGPKRRNLRMAWRSYLNRIPSGLTYTPLDPKGDYTVKLYSQRRTLLTIDGKPAPLLRSGPKYDDVTEQEFAVPREALEDGRIVVNWTREDESRLNWRQHHYVTDIWILRHDAKK